MKNMKRIIIFGLSLIIVLGAVLYGGKPNNTKAATVGQQLTEAESGWKRYDDLDFHIKYIGSWGKSSTVSGYYNSTMTYSKTPGDQAIFEFYGTKLRFIGHGTPQHPTNTSIKIDGVEETFSGYSEVSMFQRLNYEKTNLPLGIHKVIVTIPDNAQGNVALDAIDIDDSGYLIKFVESITISKTADTINTGDTHQLTATISPDDATIKDVEWSTSDSNIVTVDKSGNIKGGNPGKATITVKTKDGGLTATCEVTVVSPKTERAILTITMSNNERKEYDLSADEIKKFIDWYNGNSSPSYAITKNYNVKPFSSRTEYIAHDKVSSFEVNQYTNSDSK